MTADDLLANADYSVPVNISNKDREWISSFKQSVLLVLSEIKQLFCYLKKEKLSKTLQTTTVYDDGDTIIEMTRPNKDTISRLEE